jgi:hypothetical protein
MSDQTEGQGGAASARGDEQTAAGGGGRSGEGGTPENTSPQAAEETVGGRVRDAGVPPQREAGREEAGAAASGRTPDDSGTTQASAGEGTTRAAGEGTTRAAGEGTTRAAGEGAGETAGEGAAQTAGEGEGPAPLFGAEEGEGLRGHWEAVQAAFVDDPRAAVQQADALVVEVVEKLTSSFSSERSRLEAQWSEGEDVSTEDLRQSLRRYRSFFERLLRL